MASPVYIISSSLISCRCVRPVVSMNATRVRSMIRTSSLGRYRVGVLILFFRRKNAVHLLRFSFHTFLDVDVGPNGVGS
jgi:hypothetical protein